MSYLLPSFKITDKIDTYDTIKLYLFTNLIFINENYFQRNILTQEDIITMEQHLCFLNSLLNSEHFSYILTHNTYKQSYEIYMLFEIVELLIRSSSKYIQYIVCKNIYNIDIRPDAEKLYQLQENLKYNLKAHNII